MKLFDKHNDDFNESMRRLGGILADPSLVLSYQHTTPRAERSYMRRLGLTAEQARDLLDGLCRHGLLDCGVQSVLMQVCRERHVTAQQAAELLLRDEGWPSEDPDETPSEDN